MSGMNVLDIPEDCLSRILSRTTPRDAVRSSVVSKKFLSASRSNSVWGKFLPSDCDYFISQSSTPLDQQQFVSKKDLFFYLCLSPVLFNNNTQSFALDKWSGKKCYMLGARMLMIALGDTPHNWGWKSVPESRFPENALLRSVCWLHISGRIHTKMLSSNTTYGVYFVFKWDGKNYGFEHAPVKASIYKVDEEGLSRNDYDHSIVLKNYYLKVSENRRHLRRPEEQPVERGDGWMEIEMGRFQVTSGVEVADRRKVLEMTLKEVEDLGWKGGLLVEGIELRPLD